MPTPREISRYWFVANCPHCKNAVAVLQAHPDGHVPDIKSETPGGAHLLAECR